MEALDEKYILEAAMIIFIVIIAAGGYVELAVLIVYEIVRFLFFLFSLF